MKDNKEYTKVKMINAAAESIETPEFKTVNNKDYILYGVNNDYPYILQEMVNKSAKHNAIITKKTNMAAGKGWEYEGIDAKAFVANINGKEDLNTITFKNAYDLTLYGGFCFLVTWSKDRTKVARIQYMDFANVRLIKEIEDEDSYMYEGQQNGLDYFAISSDWSQIRKDKYKPIFVQGFSNEYKEEATQLVWVPMYRPGTQDTYPLPDYQAAGTYIALDTEISSWHLNNVKNGFSPSMMINMVGVPSDEEMKQFQRKLEKQYAGSPNAGRIILTVSEDADQIPQVVPLTLNDSDERYKDLEQQIMENIILGHRCSFPAAGIQVAGKLGTSNEIIEAELMFQRNVIDNYQYLIENTYNRIATINGIQSDLKLIKSMTFDMDELKNGDGLTNNE